jgi:hypothetical protein
MLQKKDLKKSGHNKFAGYSYFELGDFLPQTQEIFGLCGLTGIVSFEPSEATLRIYEHDGDGMILFTSTRAELSLKGCHPIQNEGAIQTYQRRYLWVACMEIVEHDAIDSAEPVKEEKIKEEKEELPLLSDEKFKSNAKSWAELILSGKKTTEQIIEFIEKNARLSDIQLSEIKSWSLK